ncbi:MAG TPA: GMC family oxidoreductase [Trebonia sp.]|nr:GMC family oxidoreductase [Trebonia sp.]
MEFDYIVVGAGAAGSVVAGRLAAESGASVLLVEYGGADHNPLLHVPKGFYYTLRGHRYLYRYPTTPAAPGGRPETWLRGRVLGGSAAVNGMMWATGAPADWDDLEQRGNPGWGAASLRPAFQALQERLGVSVAQPDEPVTRAILQSAQAYGWQQVADFNAHDGERIACTPSTISNGRRITSYRAFVRPERARPRGHRNLVVATRTRAECLLFDSPAGTRVTGVRLRHGASQHGASQHGASQHGAIRRDASQHGGSTRDVIARREVIVCAGTVETPLLLERSGIGHPDVLGPLGIRVRVASPQVGERVSEQRAVVMQVRLTDDIGPGRRVASLGGKAIAALRYLLSGQGTLATAGYDLVCQFKSSPGLARPDVHGLFTPMAIDPASSELRLARYSGVLFVGYAIRPGTFGTVHSSGPGPQDPPVITARYLQDAADRAATGAALGVARAVLGAGPVACLVDGEDFPGPGVATPAEVVSYALATGTGIYHAVGSAAMGPGDDDVVDATLRVRGVHGLRVADASVLPVQVSGGMAAPAMAIGWRAADEILGSP